MTSPLKSVPKVLSFNPDCLRRVANWTKIEKTHKLDKSSFSPESVLDDMAKYSPKMIALMQNIQELDEKDMKEHGQTFKHFIFSDVKQGGYGSKIIASSLVASGKTLAYDNKLRLKSDAELMRTPKENFALLCSTAIFEQPIKVSTKKSILGKFNERPSNINGDLIRFIVLDSGFKEGIDLFDVKYVHIFEPQTSKADQKQVIGRGTRTCGQKGLDFHPTRGWPLYVYIYDVDIPAGMRTQMGADTIFKSFVYNSGIDLRKLMFAEELERKSIVGSVDYQLNKNIHNFEIEDDEVQYDIFAGGNKADAVQCSGKCSTTRPTKSMPVSTSMFVVAYLAMGRELPIIERKPREFFCDLLRKDPSFCAKVREMYEDHIDFVRKHAEELVLAIKKKKHSNLSRSSKASFVRYVYGILPRPEKPSKVTDYVNAENKKLTKYENAGTATIERVTVDDKDYVPPSPNTQASSSASSQVQNDRTANSKLQEQVQSKNPTPQSQTAQNDRTANSKLQEQVQSKNPTPQSQMVQNDRTANSKLQEQVQSKNPTPQSQMVQNDRTANSKLQEQVQSKNPTPQSQMAQNDRTANSKLQEQVQSKNPTPQSQMVQNDRTANSKLQDIVLPEPEFDPAAIPIPTKRQSFLETRNHVIENYAQFAWPKVKLENMCGTVARGGADLIDFTPTQAFISNYFTTKTPQKGMLLFHSVGTGKTCSAIATASNTFEKEGYTILWVTRTTLKSDIWKNMFDQVCSADIKEKIMKGVKVPSELGDRMRLLSKSWGIRPMSYKQFSNLVSGSNSLYQDLVKINGKEDPLQRTLLIIDEAHKLYGGTDLAANERPDMKKLHQALMNSYVKSGDKSVKVMLMTATPFTNDPMEMIKLLNLLRLPSEQMPEDFDKFASEYMSTEGKFTKKGNRKFLDDIAGYISYLNREKDARQFSQPRIAPINVTMTTSDVANVHDIKAKYAEKIKEQTDIDKHEKEMLKGAKALAQSSKKAAKADCIGLKKNEKKECMEAVNEKISALQADLDKEAEERLAKSADAKVLAKQLKEEMRMMVKSAENDTSQMGTIMQKCLKGSTKGKGKGKGKGNSSSSRSPKSA
jgi:superfamily II DNA or RNA helicase